MQKRLLAVAFALCLSLAGSAGLADDAVDRYSDPAGQFTAMVPTAWATEGRGPLVALTAPDGRLTVYLGAFDGKDADAAVAAAWVAAEGKAPSPLQVVPMPARSGLQSARSLVYQEVEGYQRIAIAEEAAGRVFVTLISGDRIEIERRAAQINVAATGFQPAGLTQIELADAQPQPLDADAIVAFSNYVSAALADFDIPGAAIAVIQGGEVKLLEGFGTTATTGGSPVTPDTRMMIGSTTKSMTTTMMAQLVDEGLLRWEQPARSILPQFAVADAALSAEITVENLVCACTGAPRRDFEMIFNAAEMDARDVVASLREFAFATRFGEAFQYSNQMVATGGWVAAAAAGAKWESLNEGYLDIMDDRLFEPLGMTRTTFDFDTVLAEPDHATPHALHGSGRRALAPMADEAFVLTVAPAGGAWSTATDMSAFARMLLANGRWNDRTLVSADGLRRVTTPQIPVSAQMSYGLGWFVEDWNGQRLFHHGGNTTGFSSDLALLPEADAGIVILTNAGGANDFTLAVRTRFLELLFGLPHSYDAQAKIGREATVAALSVFAGAPVPAAAASWIGRYQNDALGTVSVRLDGERLLLDIGETRMELREHPQMADTLVVWEGVFLGVPLRRGTGAAPTLTFGEGATAYTFVRLE